MFALLRKNLSVFGYKKMLALFFACLIVSVSLRINSTLSFQQHVVSAVSDHYYLTYFLLPIVLFGSFSFLEDDEPIAIFRYQSYFNYFLKKWLGVAVIALMILGIQTVSILLSGIGLQLVNNWQIAESVLENDLFSVLQEIFSTPAYAFIAYSVFQWLGISFIFGIAMWLGHCFGKRGTVFTVVGLYLYSALWIKISVLQKLPMIGFNHLLILHHNLVGGQSRTFITGITLTFLSVLILLSVRQGWRGQRIVLKVRIFGITGYYWRQITMKRNLIILIITVTLMTLYKWLAGGRMLQTGEEWITVLFAGHGTCYLHLLSFLELLIIAGTPLYLLAQFIEKVVGEQSMFITIRTKGRRQIIKGILLTGGLFILLYVLLWIGTGIFCTIFSNWELSLPTLYLLLYAATMRFLDIFLQFLIMFTIYIFVKQITVGFLVIFVMHLLCIMPVSVSKYLPIGLSGLSRLSMLAGAAGLSSMAALLELSVLNMVGITLLVNIVYKKILKED